MHFSERDFPKEFLKKTNQNQMKNKLPKLSIIFQLNHGGQFNYWRKLQYKVNGPCFILSLRF